MLWSRPDVIKAWKGWKQWKSRERDIERARELSDLPDTKTNAKEGKGNQRLLRLRTLWLGENYNKIFYFVGQCPNISADNIISEGTDF